MSPRKNPHSTTYPTATSAEATAIEHIVDHFRRNPHEAPVTLLEVQKGRLFKRSQQKEEDRIPRYQNIGQVSSDVMKHICTALMPQLTVDVWARLQRANKPGTTADGDKTRIENKIFYKLTGERSNAPLVCCSRGLLTEIYVAQAAARPVGRTVVLNADFTLDLENGGCYRWGQEQETIAAGKVYTSIVHCSGAEAMLPERRVFLKGRVELRKNYLDDGCVIYDVDEKSSFKVIDRFVEQRVAPFLVTTKSVAKGTEFKTRVEENNELENKRLELDEEGDLQAGAVAASGKKRKLMRVGSLSDLAVPSSLAASSPAPPASPEGPPEDSQVKD